ncbi:hypothetical protein OUZ56_027287 [Daphnia magna]|uniref:Uncharacterized protein n=1 Tax=Daphnia magna TaxID=35525 RepID=A0ABQ9ZPB6_9CRUS|nr:hypothetical protein OUZ56_027287 [Daphnia magna]
MLDNKKRHGEKWELHLIWHYTCCSLGAKTNVSEDLRSLNAFDLRRSKEWGDIAKKTMDEQGANNWLLGRKASQLIQPKHQCAIEEQGIDQYKNHHASPAATNNRLRSDRKIKGNRRINCTMRRKKENSSQLT